MNQLDPAGVLVHEIGHGLGFLHEEERPDLPPWACADEGWPNDQVEYFGAANHTDGSGDPAFVWDCDEAYKDQQFVDTVTADDWSSYGFQLRQFNAAGADPLCLGPIGTAPGSQVQIRTCSQGT